MGVFFMGNNEEKTEVGLIGAEQLELFGSLLLPEMEQAIAQGEPYTAIGISADEVACGALAGYEDDECFYLRSFYVAPDYRGRGIGAELLNALKQLLQKIGGVYALELSFTSTDPEHEQLRGFLEHNGFEQQDDKERTIWTFSLGDFVASELFQKNVKSSHDVCAFSEIPEDMLSAMQKRGVVQETPLPEQTMTGADVERAISHALICDGRAEAYVVFDHSFGGMLTLCALWIGEAGPSALYALLRESFRRANELYPPETKIALQAVNEQSARLVRTLVPGAARMSYTYRCQLGDGGVF